MSTDPDLTAAIDTHTERDAELARATQDGRMLGHFIAAFRDTSGIDDEEELGYLARGYLEKLYPDAQHGDEPTPPTPEQLTP